MLRLVLAFGPRFTSGAAFVVAAAATIPFAVSDSATPLWLLECALFVRGLRMGVVFIPIMANAYEGLSRPQVPEASAITGAGSIRNNSSSSTARRRFRHCTHRNRSCKRIRGFSYSRFWLCVLVDHRTWSCGGCNNAVVAGEAVRFLGGDTPL